MTGQVRSSQRTDSLGKGGSHINEIGPLLHDQTLSTLGPIEVTQSQRAEGWVECISPVENSVMMITNDSPVGVVR